MNPSSLWTINIEEISKNSKNLGNFYIVVFGVENWSRKTKFWYMYFILIHVFSADAFSMYFPPTHAFYMHSWHVFWYMYFPLTHFPCIFGQHTHFTRILHVFLIHVFSAHTRILHVFNMYFPPTHAFYTYFTCIFDTCIFRPYKILIHVFFDTCILIHVFFWYMYFDTCIFCPRIFRKIA